MSPIQYQKRLRLQEARRRLLSGRRARKEIAYEVGYASASRFGREYLGSSANHRVATPSACASPSPVEGRSREG